MTDSKTAKKIQIIPCPFDHADPLDDVQRYAIEIDDYLYKEALGPFCGTEAEAQAKARELREWEEKEAYAEESKHQKYDQRIAEFAAAQPTETRPPQKVYTMFRNKRFGTWSIAFNGQALISGLSKEDAENTLKRYNEAARAAAPVEPPMCGKYLGDWRNLNVRCQLPKYHEGNCSCDKPATELVEPAPRPQFCGWCGRIDCTTHPSNAPGPSAAPTHFGCCGRLFTRGHAQSCAASSPVARPQPEYLIDRIINRIAELPDRSSPEDWPEAMLVTDAELRLILLDELAEPAARVEQPTWGDKLRANTLNDGYVDAAPAAPVVEQRPKLTIWAFLMTRNNLSHDEREVIEKFLKRYEEFERTEGEGQHG